MPGSDFNFVIGDMCRTYGSLFYFSLFVNGLKPVVTILSDATHLQELRVHFHCIHLKITHINLR